MSNYKLKLYAKNGSVTEFELHLKECTEILNDYQHIVSRDYIFNDYAYLIKVVDNKDIVQTVDATFINNEIVDKSLSRRHEYASLFIECFGLVKIEVVIDGCSYVTDNISLMMNKNSVNQGLIHMIDYIYDNCDDYLYEEHKNSKISTGIKPNTNISLDSKLSMLEDIYNTYVNIYQVLRYSPQSKLINLDKIGNFQELQNIQANTIRYISTHPEELRPVNYNSGIVVDGQYYQPNKTLVKSVTYSYDIYENRVIVGFLQTIINELQEIKKFLIERYLHDSQPKEKDNYIESSYYIYTRNTRILKGYIDYVDPLILKFKNLFEEYHSILPVKNIVVMAPPEYTNVFQGNITYRVMFQKIRNWFMCGNYILKKYELLLSFVSISKIYEYYCLIRINKTLEYMGFSLNSSMTFKYKEKKYYRNTIYNNTFEFYKKNNNVTVYFQPIIYNELMASDYSNNINLFRSTTISISDIKALALLGGKDVRTGTYYNPDYLIKVTNDESIYYFVLDAKYSTSNNIKQYQLPFLTYKYLFSLNPTVRNEYIAGLIIFCGKNEVSKLENIHDIAEKNNYAISPSAHIVNLLGDCAEKNNNLCDLFNEIIFNQKNK